MVNKGIKGDNGNTQGYVYAPYIIDTNVTLITDTKNPCTQIYLKNIKSRYSVCKSAFFEKERLRKNRIKIIKELLKDE